MQYIELRGVAYRRSLPEVQKKARELRGMLKEGGRSAADAIRVAAGACGAGSAASTCSMTCTMGRTAA